MSPKRKTNPEVITTAKAAMLESLVLGLLHDQDPKPAITARQLAADTLAKGGCGNIPALLGRWAKELTEASKVEAAKRLEAEGKLGATKPAKVKKAKAERKLDPRLPSVGTVMTRDHDGKKVNITVLEAGFEYGGKEYRSLSAIAREVTGTIWNGFLWMGLAKRG